MVLQFGTFTLVHANPAIPPAVTAVSIGIAFLGAYMAICFCEQFRLAKVGDGKQKSKLLSRKGVFLLMSLSLGGVATWAMNFVAIAGLTLVAPQIKPTMDVPIEYMVVPTILSLVISCIFSCMALYIGSQDKMFAKTKQEIVEQFVAHSSKLSFKEIQKISNLRMIFIISTQSLHSLVIGGIISGTGTIVTLCLGFIAIKVDNIDIVFNIPAIVGATALSWFVCIVAFWILFRLLSLYPHMEWLRIASAGLIALNRYFVRLIIRNSLDFHIIGTTDGPSEWFKNTPTLSQELGYMACLAASVIFCFILVLIAFSDLRMWLYASNARVTRLETLLETLKKENSATADIIVAYMRRHDASHSLASGVNSSRHGSQLSSINSNKGAGADSTDLTVFQRIARRVCCCFVGNTVNPAVVAEEDGLGELHSGYGSPGNSSRFASSARTGRLDRESVIRKANEKTLALRSGTATPTTEAIDFTPNESNLNSRPPSPISSLLRDIPGVLHMPDNMEMECTRPPEGVEMV